MIYVLLGTVPRVAKYVTVELSLIIVYMWLYATTFICLSRFHDQVGSFLVKYLRLSRRIQKLCLRYGTYLYSLMILVIHPVLILLTPIGNVLQETRLSLDTPGNLDHVIVSVNGMGFLAAATQRGKFGKIVAFVNLRMYRKENYTQSLFTANNLYRRPTGSINHASNVKPLQVRQRAAKQRYQKNSNRMNDPRGGLARYNTGGKLSSRDTRCFLDSRNELAVTWCRQMSVRVLSGRLLDCCRVTLFKQWFVESCLPERAHN